MAWMAALNSWQEQEILPYPRLALGPTWIPGGGSFPGVKRLESEADSLPPYSDMFKNDGTTPLFFTHLHGMVLN
jgi:hypothetical protein